MDITASISQECQAYYNDVLVSLSDGDPATSSDVINYTLETMQALEKITGDSDPVSFLEKVSEGAILIVKK